ncbi:hypothetical protein ACHAQC_011954, partial [Fusarium culmorum]
DEDIETQDLGSDDDSPEEEEDNDDTVSDSDSNWGNRITPRFINKVVEWKKELHTRMSEDEY